MCDEPMKIEGNEQSSRIRVLSIDDDPDDQLILKRALEERIGPELELVMATNPSDGLRKIEESGFDLVLVDYRLPQMTGLEFLRELRWRRLDTPAIILTGRGDERIAVEAMKLGARDYVLKDDIDSCRLVDDIAEIILQSALPEKIDPVVAKELAELFSRSSDVSVEVQQRLITHPEGGFPADRLIAELDKLEAEGIVEAQPIHTVVGCPRCPSTEAVFHIVCPDCRSVQLTKGEALEHLTCGHVDFRSSYERDGDLVCPKCGRKMKQIGVDYRRLGSYYKCNNNHISGYPAFNFTCSQCGEEFDLESAQIKILNRYRLTKDGRRKLRLSSMKGIPPCVEMTPESLEPGSLA